jgi:hypothetical protein
MLAILLTIWWRQQTFRWPILLLVCMVIAPLMSWWSGLAFQVSDYRAGCDGLCPGFRGAPILIARGESAGGEFLPGMFLLNSAVYLVLLLSWSGIVRTLLRSVSAAAQRRTWYHVVLAVVLLFSPLALAPLYLPPPEARVRGDPMRIAINAGREVYLYDQFASSQILRVALEDVRPRNDGQTGMRVCLRTYSFFYMPNGRMYLDMTAEGVHSNGGGVVPLEQSCWD